MEIVNTLQSKMTKMVNENPFYGKNDLLALMQGVSVNDPRPLMNKAWEECKNDKHLREVFFTIVFSIGDISNRDHNIFNKTKVENGGNSNRQGFMYAMEWILKHTPKQYYAFLKADLFRQYVCLFNVLGTQVQTNKGQKTIYRIINMLDGVNLDEVADYLAMLIKQSHPGEKAMIAKWLVNPRLSKRQKFNREGKREGSRELQAETKQLQLLRVDLYSRLSERMGWIVEQHQHNKRFVGLSEWKKEWNGSLESVLFSSGKIREFDEQQFVSWLNTLPSGARYRVRRRLLDGNNKPKSKWISNHGGANMGQWILNWEAAKLEAQAEQRKLEEAIRQGDASEETKEKLQKVKKEAKVTTGADTLFSLFEKLSSGMTGTEFDTIVQGILDKVKFQIPVLTIADCSGSMSGLPTLIARLTTTLCMLKNPSEDLDNVLVRFGSTAEFITDGSKGELKQNRFMQGQTVKVNSLIDRTASFRQNFNTISNMIHSNMGGTNFETVADAFKRWVDSSTIDAEKQVKREMIQQYPVFLLISDGDLNSGPSATESMARFQRSMQEWFGWTGVVVVWNVNTRPLCGTDYFKGLSNVIHYYGYNAGIINSIFTKIHDLDIIDVFTPLKSLSELKRYEPIRKATL